MSGFLRQLASRSLGTAPRLRSAPSPLAAALHGVVPADPPRAGGQRQEGQLAEQDASAQAGSDWAVSGNRAGQAPSGRPALAAQARAADTAGMAARPAPQEPAMQPGYPIETAPFADAGTPAPDALPRAQEAISPWHRPLTSEPGKRDLIAPDARRPLPASVPPATQSMPPAAARGAQALAGNGHAASRIDPATADTQAARTERRAPASPAPRPAQPPSPPEVHITIDRLEVAAPPPLPRPAAAARSSAIALRDYLAARRARLP